MLRLAVSIAALFCLATGVARAEEFKVPLDQARALPLGEEAAGVAIGNPAIAAVTVQNSRLLFVTGRSYGSTNIVVVNHAGRPILDARLTVVPDDNSAMMVTMGATTRRFDCNPQCRRRPDIADDPKSFNDAQTIITARGGGTGQ